MSASSKQLSECYWIVDQNAKVQAKYDATTVSPRKAIEYAENQNSWPELVYLLNQWRSGDGTDVLFNRVPSEIVNTLTDGQREQVISFWISVYSIEVLALVRDRVKQMKENSNGST